MSFATRLAVVAAVYLQPNDGPRGLASRHFLETGVVVHGLRSEPHRVVFGSSRLVNGISLDQRHAALASVPDCALEQGASHSLAAVLGGYDETDDGPDGFLVDRLHDRGAFKLGELVARRQRNPTDRLFAAVRDE